MTGTKNEVIAAFEYHTSRSADWFRAEKELLGVVLPPVSGPASGVQEKSKIEIRSVKFNILPLCPRHVGVSI